MASKPPIECQLCHEEIRPGRKLEAHLLEEHTKRELAKYVISQNQLRMGSDASD